MTEAIALAPAHRKQRRPKSLNRSLLRVRRIGYLVLGLQLAGFLFWSTVLYDRFQLTADFSQYQQAWFLITHGQLNPSDTIEHFSFWQNHSEFIMWPLAVLYWAWPHDVTLMWLQDISVVCAEAVAFTWICEIAGRRLRDSDAIVLVGGGLALLAVNPWIWWSVSWDFHSESVAVLFAALLAWDLAHGRRRAWAWVAPLLCCGIVAATYVAGIGLGGVVAGKRSRLSGVIIACLSVLAMLAITAVHGNAGSDFDAYGYLAAGTASQSLTTIALLKGVVTHPIGVMRTFWLKRVDVLANLAPAGIAGLCDPLILPLALAVLMANVLFSGLLFAEPIFQNLPIYILLPVGSIAVLATLTHHHRRTALLLAGFIVAQAVAWSLIWAPRTPSQWLRVSTPAAATLTSIEARIPETAEVIVSQGVMGRFCNRVDVHPLYATDDVPLDGGPVWIVVAPSEGIETESTASAMGLIEELAGPLHATLVTHANGVWAFRWRPPSGTRALNVPGNTNSLPAWTAPLAAGSVGRLIISGSIEKRHITSTERRGYVADELAWLVPVGSYQVHVRLSSTGPVNVEVWNDNGDVLLTRRSISATNGVESIPLQVNAATSYGSHLYRGWGPFQADFVPPPAGQRLEVRVWSAGAGTVNVYGADIARASP
jgi:Predicted membrane protein (DUF2079)